MKEKRVLLIGPMPPCIGGDSVSTLNISQSRYWKDAGFSITTINTTSKDKIRTEGEWYPVGDSLRFMRILIDCALQLPRSNVVLLWANTRFLCTAGPALIPLFSITRVPLVIKMFGTSLPCRIAELRNPRKAAVISLLMKARHLLPETEGLGKELSLVTGIPISSMICFPNFVPDRHLTEKREPRSFTGKCIFVGQIKREKGIFTILEALKDRDDLSCAFYGPLIDRDREEFLDQISSHQNCAHHGIIEPSEVVRTISKHDVLLLPTFHKGEGHPAVILQAFAAGVPVIASNWKYIPELVENGSRGLLVPAKSPDALLQAIDLVAADNELRQSIAENSLKYVKDFSEKRIVNDILVKLVDRELIPSLPGQAK